MLLREESDHPADGLVDVNTRKGRCHMFFHRGIEGCRILEDSRHEVALLDASHRRSLVEYRKLGDIVFPYVIQRLANRGDGVDGNQFGYPFLSLKYISCSDALRHEKPVLPHPIIIVDLAQIPFSGIGEKNDHHIIFIQFLDIL